MTVFVYTKSPQDFVWNQQYTPYTKEYLDQAYCYVESPDRRNQRRLRPGETPLPGWRRFSSDNLVNPGVRPNLRYPYSGYPPPPNGWKIAVEEMQRLDREGRLLFPEDPNGRIRLKRCADEMPGRLVQDLWDGSSVGQLTPRERLGYETQKPEGLLERTVNTSSNPEQLVADFFCGSGTPLAVAEKLGRRWIGCDLGRYAIHISRKRLLEIEGCKPFEILNLDKYERQYWPGANFW